MKETERRVHLSGFPNKLWFRLNQLRGSRIVNNAKYNEHRPATISGLIEECVENWLPVIEKREP